MVTASVTGIATPASFALINLVASSPVVLTQPTSQTALAGSSVTLTATASGVPAPTVQWLISTNGGGIFTQINGATATTLTLSNVTQAMSGYEYEAIFTNSTGSATTNAATLTVETPPAILTQPSSQTHSPSDTVIFTAAATGTPTPTVQWEISSNSGASFANIPAPRRQRLPWLPRQPCVGMSIRLSSPTPQEPRRLTPPHSTFQRSQRLLRRQPTAATVSARRSALH